MTIRPLGPADLAAYKAIRLRLLSENPFAFGSSAEETALRPDSDHLASLDDPTGRTYTVGAWEGDALVGVMMLRREANRKYAHKAHLVSVYVAPEARGKGHAKALLAAVVAHARSLSGLERILLSVASDNLGAIALYQAAGFETYGTEPRALKHEGRYVDFTQMALAL